MAPFAHRASRELPRLGSFPLQSFKLPRGSSSDEGGFSGGLSEDRGRSKTNQGDADDTDIEVGYKDDFVRRTAEDGEFSGRFRSHGIDIKSDGFDQGRGERGAIKISNGALLRDGAPAAASPEPLITETTVASTITKTGALDATTVVIISTVVATPDPTTTFIPLMSAIAPSQPAGFRKGVESAGLPDASNIRFNSVTLVPTLGAAKTALPASGATTVSKDQGKPGGMSQDAQHALISVGSIGSFILVCFLFWFIRRSLRKRDGRGGDASQLDGSSPLPNRFIAKIPYLNRRVKAWENLEGSANASVTDIKPIFDPSRGMAAAPRYHRRNSSFAQQSTASLPGATQVANGIRRSRTGSSAYSNQQAQSATLVAPAMAEANEGTRSSIIDAYYSLPDGSGNPSNGKRESQVSSLSSGFGDGDIIVPLHPPPAAAQKATGDYGLPSAGFSWTNNRAPRARETIYTQTSEDSPAKFRSITSWVDQQTGRVHRAAARQEDDLPPHPGVPVPGYHQMPPSPRFNMMLDDEQPPRRPDGMPATYDPSRSG